MKRKRGHKKGKKSKKSKSITEQGDLNESTENSETQTSEQCSEPPTECENSEHESKMEVDTPSSTGIANSPIAGSVDTGAPADNNTLVKPVARVKVKLKTSKALESDETSRNEIDKSSVQAGLEKPAPAVPAEKKEDLRPCLPERKPVFLNVYRKTKGIKIKSFKPVDGSSSVTEKSADAVKAQDAIVIQKDTKAPNENSQASKQEPESAPVSLQKEEKKTDQNSGYNKQELEDSLTVIKNIMKMDAADPFNVPVDPEALGIPDYFDIIKTPMDFGTICKNLEKGNKYMNSEDVYKDVHYIWHNCSKYNKKGDYIVDLMKRVKKNFMKNWTAAGLYTEQSAENAEDGGKSSTKGSKSKHKSHKRHGRHHKSDCMCAVCVLKRRKRERERDSQGHSGAQEESSPARSPSVDNSSINIGEEQDNDTDVDNKTEQDKTEIVELLDSPVSKRQKVSESKQEVEEDEVIEVESETKTEANVEGKTRPMEDTGNEPVTSAADKLVVLASNDDPKSVQNEEEEKIKRLRKQKEVQELERKEWRVKMHEKFQIKNPELLSLSEVLFPNNKTSVWNGPHSLFKHKGGSKRSSALHKAVEALMKK